MKKNSNMTQAVTRARTPDPSDPIQISGAAAGYSRRSVLADLDLYVPAGSVTALLGVNGVGKSTLLRVLTGELPAKSGEVRVLGRDPRRETHALLREIGYVPDRIELPTWMRIQDHMRLLAPLYPTWDAAEVRRLCTLFELDPKQPYRDLSRGQRVLENLAMALAHRPKLLLLDEPFAGLDPLSRRRVIDGVFEHLGEEAGSLDAGHAFDPGEHPTVFFASHGLQVIERCADRVALLSDGACIVNTSLEDLQQRSTRLLVRRSSADAWIPPGAPIIEGQAADSSDSRETVLYYADLAPETLNAILEALEDRDDVEAVLELDRNLEDLFLAIGACSKDLDRSLNPAPDFGAQLTEARS